MTRAIVDLNKSIRLESNIPLSYLNRAIIYVQMGELNDALSDFNTFIKSDDKPYLGMAYKNRAVVYLFLHRFQDAIDDVETAKSYGLRDDQIDLIRSVAHDKLKAYSASINDMTDAISRAPSAHLYRLRANIYFQEHNLSAALNDLDMAISMDPSNKECRLALAQIYLMMDRIDDAKTTYSSLIADEPHNPEYHVRLGDAFQIKREYQKAIEEYNIALKYDPTRTAAIFGRGESFLNLGRNSVAITDFRIVLKMPSSQYVKKQTSVLVELLRNHPSVHIQTHIDTEMIYAN